MNNHKQTWLILAHCFNMDGRAASQTITDKIPFLMEKGVVPIVVSAPTGSKDQRFVHHQVLSPAPSGINFEMRKIIERDFQNSNTAKVFKAVVTLLCLPFLILEKIVINLDSHWSWFISSTIKSYCLIKKDKPQLIYSTAGPSSTHLSGYILKKMLHIPWIAEIHDPLVPENGEKRYQRYAFHKWLEEKIFQTADAVIYFTENACDNARKRTGITANSYVLRPGANPPEINGVHYKKTDEFHFGHFGSLAADRNLSFFLEALSGVIKDQPCLKGTLKLDVYGTVLDTESKNAVKTFSLDDVVCEYGRLEFDPLTGKSGRQQVFEKMHQCDVLVLLHGSSDISDEYIPSKLYEYLLTQRPILGIASKHSELGVILNKTGHTVFDPESLNKMISMIRKYIYQWQNDQLREGKQSEFTVEKTVEKLMQIAESCCHE